MPDDGHFGATAIDKRPVRTITTRVPCSEHFPTRDAALMAHATQVDPDGWWFRMPRELEARVWPTEDFEAALSYVPVHAIEDDLFAGLPDAAAADALATSAHLTVAYDGRAHAGSTQEAS